MKFCLLFFLSICAKYSLYSVESVRIRKQWWAHLQQINAVNDDNFDHSEIANRNCDQSASGDSVGDDLKVVVNPSTNHSDQSNDVAKNGTNSADNSSENDCQNRERKKGTKNKFSKLQKQRIINQYMHLINAFKRKGTHSKNEWKDFEEKLAKILGVQRRTIFTWKRQFGFPVVQYTEEERLEKLRDYYKMKRRDPNMTNVDIAGELGLSECTLKRWRRKFEDAIAENSRRTAGEEGNQRVGRKSDSTLRRPAAENSLGMMPYGVGTIQQRKGRKPTYVVTH